MLKLVRERQCKPSISSKTCHFDVVPGYAPKVSQFQSLLSWFQLKHVASDTVLSVSFLEGKQQDYETQAETDFPFKYYTTQANVLTLRHTESTNPAEK
jgi:hypothetical protein